MAALRCRLSICTSGGLCCGAALSPKLYQILAFGARLLRPPQARLPVIFQRRGESFVSLLQWIALNSHLYAPSYFHPHLQSLVMGLTSAQGEQYASLITLGVAATIAVILRFIARARSKASFGLDDYFSLIALFFYLVYVGVSLWGRCSVISCQRKALNHPVQGLRLAMLERTQQNCHCRYSK